MAIGPGPMPMPGPPMDPFSDETFEEILEDAYEESTPEETAFEEEEQVEEQPIEETYEEMIPEDLEFSDAILSSESNVPSSFPEDALFAGEPCPCHAAPNTPCGCEDPSEDGYTYYPDWGFGEEMRPDTRWTDPFGSLLTNVL